MINYTRKHVKSYCRGCEGCYILLFNDEEIQHVYNKYSMWCVSGGMKPLNRNKFVSVVSTYGYRSKQIRVTKEMKLKGINKDRITIFEAS